jgi:MFS family permease
MQSSETEYRRLAGKGRRRGSFIRVTASHSRLWLGRDHLLLVDSTGYEENYKRFYFRDIKAITIQRTNRGRIIGIVSGLWLALGVVLAFATGTVGAWIFGILSGIILCVFVTNLALGPTALCHLRTAVQVEELACWNRLRRARAAMERIRPLIIAAQGELSTETLQAAIDEPAAAPPFVDAPPRIVPSAVMPPPPNNYRGGVHLFLFCTLVLDVVTTTLYLIYLPGSGALNALFFVVMLGAGIVALVKQRRSCLPQAIRRLALLAVVTLAATFLTGIIHGMIVAMGRLAIDAPYGTSSYSTAERSDFSLWSTLISTIITGFSGAYGLLLMRRFRKTLSAPPSKIQPLSGGPASTPS